MRIAWRLVIGCVVAPLLGIALYRLVLLGSLLAAAMVLSLSDREVDDFPGILVAAEVLAALIAVVGMVLTWRALAPRGARASDDPEPRGEA